MADPALSGQNKITMPNSKVDAAYKVSSGEDEVESPATEETPTTEEVETGASPEADETKEETPQGDGEGEETPAEETPAEGAEGTEEAPQGEETPEGEEVHRPTRSERRIHQLTQKLKQTPSETPETPHSVPSEETPREEVHEVLPWQPQEGQNLSPEQLQALIAEGVSRELSTREEQQAVRTRAEAWLGDYESVVKQNPELDQSSPKYNKKLDDLLETMLTNPDGSPRLEITVSQALGQLRGALTSAERSGAEKASVKLAKQAEESALTPGSGDDVETESFTDDEIKAIRTKDPRRYNQLIKEGKI